MSDTHSDRARMEVPQPLRLAIARDLRPVAPLPPPRMRMLWLLPFAIVLLFGFVWLFGLRVDSRRLGLALTWGASAFQMLLSIVLMAAALRESVPGTTLSRRVLGAAFGTAAIAVLTITWMTWSISPTTVVPRAVGFVWRICFGATILSALPPLAVAGWLSAGAFPLRPRLAGALYGLGAGLMADAGWRLFCHYSDPTHVFGAHTLAVAVTMTIGVVVAQVLQRRSSRQSATGADG